MKNLIVLTPTLAGEIKLTLAGGLPEDHLVFICHILPYFEHNLKKNERFLFFYQDYL